MPMYEVGTSQTRYLDVLPDPFAVLVDYAYPPSLRQGQQVTIYVTVRNDGGDGYCNAQLEDADTGQELSEYGENLESGQQFYMDFPFVPNMPGQDWNLRIRYGHQDIFMNQLWEGDVTFTISMSIPTALTLSLVPAIVAPGGLVAWNGLLTRTDTGVGVASQPVYLQAGPAWTPVTTETTDTSGLFTGSFTAPVAAGSYQYRARFEGAQALSPAEATANVNVGGLQIDPIVVAVGALVAVGAAAWFLTR